MRRAVALLLALVALGDSGCAPRRPAKTTSADEAATKKSSPANSAEAKRRFDAGLRLFEDKAYPEALAAFEQAYKIGSAPAALRYMALCQRRLKHVVQAYDSYYEQLLSRRDAELTPDEKREATQALEELGALTETLLVVVGEPDAEIEVDGRMTLRSPMPKAKRLRAASHQLRVTKAGFVPFEQSAAVEAKEAKTIEVKLEADS